MREEIEEALLSKLMNKKNLYYSFYNTLTVDLFSNDIYKEIFISIDLLYQQGKTFDLLAAFDSCTRTKKWKKDVKFDYTLAKIFASESYHLDFQNCLNFLIGENKKQRLVSLMHDTQQKIDDGYDTIDEVIEKTIQNITKISEHKQDDLANMNKQIDTFLIEVKDNCSKEGITGITSGFNSIDRHTNGWKKQDLVIVGGASSMGKTSLALGLAFNAAKNNIPSVIFSYEMSSSQLITRLVSSESGIENRTISSGLLTKPEFDKVIDTSNYIKSLPLFVDECSNTSLRYLLNRIRRYVITNNVELIMIDYLQLVNNFSKSRSREQEVSQIARSLKNIAKELNVSIIALSQLSRNVQNRAGCRPTLGDLRESGEIEQAADTVIFVYRPEYYGIDRDEDGNNLKGKAEIIFAKGRNIGIGNINLDFNNKYTKFDEPNVNYANEYFTIENS
jgi:replicative DNA helicase